MGAGILKILIAAIIFFHAAIHLMGFAKAWNLAEVKELTGETIIPLSSLWIKLFGVGWLLACLIFLVADAALLINTNWWRIAAAAGIALSQILIIFYWKDARAGTIANILITAAIFA